MYETNQQPLPEGEASQVFAESLAEIQQVARLAPAPPLSSDSVVRWAETRHRPMFESICRRLLLPGSEVVGLEHLRELVRLANEGQSCLLCLNHCSNLDTPTLATLLTDVGEAELFDRLIWIAGRKLEEDGGLASLLIRGFNRVLLTPHSWFEAERTEAEVKEARRINMAAERAMLKLRRQGWVFALFPSGTRRRPGDESTRQAIAETDSYLRAFDHLLLCHISGCTLPVSRNQGFTHETPQLDRMIYTFGSVQRTLEWREAMAERYPELDQRAASAKGIEAEIDALAPELLK